MSPNTHFNGLPLSDTEYLRNGTQLQWKTKLEPYTCPTQQCNLNDFK